MSMKEFPEIVTPDPLAEYEVMIVDPLLYERQQAVVVAARAIAESRDFVPTTNAACVLEARLLTALAELADVAMTGPVPEGER